MSAFTMDTDWLHWHQNPSKLNFSLLLGLLMRTVMFWPRGQFPLLQSVSIPPVVPPRINSGTYAIFGIYTKRDYSGDLSWG